MAENPHGSQNPNGSLNQGQPNPNDPQWQYNPSAAEHSAGAPGYGNANNSYSAGYAQDAAGAGSASAGGFQGSYGQQGFQQSQGQASGQPPAFSDFSQGAGYAAPGGPVEKPVVPGSVKLAFYAVLAIVVIGLVSSIAQMVNPGILNEQILSVFGLDAEQAGEIESSGPEAVLSFVFSLVQFAVYVVFAVFMAKGHNWARIVVTVILGLQVVGGFFNLLVMLFVGFHWILLLGVLGSVFAVVGLVCLWLKSSNVFYAKMKSFNQWKTYSMYR